MFVINATNVNDAYTKGLALLREVGVEEDSRAGRVLVAPCPVTTVYSNPRERVLFDAQRDANPWLHLFESLWLLDGRNDARWLDRFVGDFSKRFAEEDGTLHGSYGFRWRHHFDMEGGGQPGVPDQLTAIVRLLKKNPKDRRVVLQMWDPVADLGVDKKDVPCNTQVYLRIREEDNRTYTRDGDYQGEWERVLDITVCCRSNDLVWGCFGSNAVQFSFLLEYLAARIGVGIGTYTQISNNFHSYLDVLEKVGTPKPSQPYLNEAFAPTPMVFTPNNWDTDLESFMSWTASEEPDQNPQQYPDNPWFELTAEPFFVAHHFWKQKDRAHALEILENADGMSPDWRTAGMEWMRRRMVR